MSDTRLIIKESIHAYTHLGEPVPLVPLAKPKIEGLCMACKVYISIPQGKKDVRTCPECKQKVSVASFDVVSLTKTTTKHMKQYGLFPSISRIATYGEAPFEMTAWHANRRTNFIMDHYHPNRKKWMNTINRDLSDFENEAADRGTDIHGWLQKVLSDEPVQLPDDDVIQRCTCDIVQWVAEQGYEYTESERYYCDPHVGLAGTIDLVGVRGSDAYVSDFKTKMNPKTFAAMKKGNASYLWGVTKQLAGYSMIHPLKPTHANVIPISNEDGEIAVVRITKEELALGKRAMIDNAQAWFSNNRYDPREMYKNGDCKSLDQILGEKE